MVYSLPDFFFTSVLNRTRVIGFDSTNQIRHNCMYSEIFKQFCSLFM